MAIVANTVISTAVGMREDLSDVITRVSPEKTPFTSNIGTDKAENTYTEWQTENLTAASATNSAVEGDVFTVGAATPTVRIGVQCQILTKTIAVSRTDEVVKKAGRASELNRQKVIKGIEIRRDFEMTAIGNNTSRVESGSNGRRTGGALAWLTTNTSLGASGANHGWAANVVVKADDGTQRTFTESQVKTVLSACFSAGGMPNQAYMGPADKQAFSQFTGIASIRSDAKGASMATIVAAADVYVSDFGNIALIPHAYGLTRDCFFCDPTLWKVAVLDGYKTTPLAQTTDSTTFALTYEAGLKSLNQAGSGVVRDLL